MTIGEEVEERVYIPREMENDDIHDDRVLYRAVTGDELYDTRYVP